MSVDDRLLQLRQLESRIADMASAAEATRAAGGGGGSGGDSDAWRKGVEEQLKRNADDVRALLRGVVATGLVIIGMIVGLYVYTGNKTDLLANQIGAIRVEQEQARGDLRTMNATLTGKLDRIADRLPAK